MAIALDDEALVAKARSAKERDRKAAFEDLYAALAGPVFQLCYRVTGSRGEAEDALQNCFLSVSKALRDFRGESTIATWVLRIALRASWREKARRPRGSVPLDAGLEVSSGDAEPDRLAASRQDVARVSRALETLSEEHQAILSLFAVDGLGHQEIASVLGVPEGTVWSRLHAARKKLGLALEAGNAH